MEFDSNGSTKVVLYQTEKGNFASIAASPVDFEYSVTPIGRCGNCFSVQRILFPVHIDPSVIIQKHIFPLDEDISWIKYIRNNIDLHVANILKIAPRLGWKPIGEGIQCCSNFKNWVIQENIAGSTELNFSGLGLTLIPPQIELFADLKKLDLSNNQLRILPVELQRLSHLIFVDLRNNPIVELPDWLEKRKDIEVKTDIIQSNPDEWAQESA